MTKELAKIGYKKLLSKITRLISDLINYSTIIPALLKVINSNKTLYLSNVPILQNCVSEPL